MKYIFLIFSILISFSLTGCLFKTTINGSGFVSEEQRSVSPFDKIEINGLFTVYLSQGDFENVEVEIDDNLQEYVEVRNEGSKLVLGIDSKVNFGKITQNNIYITVKNIDLVRVSGVCNLKTQGPLKCTVLTFKVQGVFNGELELFCDKLDANIAGVSYVNLRGDATELNVKQTGVGAFNAMELNADRVNVKNSGAGSVSVYATQELSMINSNAGSIKYSGNAEIKTNRSSGIGKIRKVE